MKEVLHCLEENVSAHLIHLNQNHLIFSALFFTFECDMYNTKKGFCLLFSLSPMWDFLIWQYPCTECIHTLFTIQHYNSVSVPTLHKHMCWKFPTLLTHTKWLCSVRPFIPFTRIFCSESFYTLLTYILFLLIMGLFINHQLYMLKAFPYYLHT